jgi:hypothetical protein
MADSFDDYHALGVGPDAPPDAVRRAHRRQAVIEHRRGIFRLEGRLRRLDELAQKLLDPGYHGRHEQQHQLARTALLRLPPADERDRARRIGRRRHDFRKEIGESSLRVSREAVSAHAEAMRIVGEEHDRREAREARTRARRALMSVLVRLSLVAAMVSTALYLWSRH